jgi:hypothetical protein
MAKDLLDNEATAATNNAGLAPKLDAAGWGLFFIWVGAALLLDLSWGVGILGVAVIILLGQAARKYFGIALEGFWIVVGLLFLLGGFWELYKVEVNLVPILLIVAGAALLISIFRRRRAPTE